MSSGRLLPVPQHPVFGDESQLRVSGWPFPEASVLQQGSWSIWNQPSQLTSRVYFFHLSALQETLFSLETWHFLVLAHFPGQHSCSPALSVIQQRCVERCHCLCAFAILPSVPAPRAAGGRAAGAGSFDSGCALTWRMLCCCSTCQVTSKLSPAHVPQVAEIGRRGVFQGTDTSKPGMARISHWALPSHCLPGLLGAVLVAMHCLPVCTAQPPPLRWSLQPLQLHWRSGNPAPSWERIRMAPDNTLRKNDTATMRVPKPQPAGSVAGSHWDSLLSQNWKKTVILPEINCS